MSEHAPTQPDRRVAPLDGPLHPPSPVVGRVAAGQATETGPHIAIPPGETHSGPIDRRLDPPHASPLRSVDAAADAFLDELSPAPASSTKFRAPRTDEELLLQASQIAEHLRSQFAELDRREKAINEQLSLIDQERRRVRLWVHQFEEEMFDRDEALKAREAEFAEKLNSCDQLVRELEEQERAMLEIRDKLTLEQSTWKEDAYREIEIEREALRQTQRVLDAERKQLAEAIERRRTEHEENLRSIREQLIEEEQQLRAGLEQERATLHARLAADLEAERMQFERERAEWQTFKSQELADINREREFVASAMQRAEAELSAFRAGQLAEIEDAKREQAKLLEAERDLLDAQRREQEMNLAQGLEDQAAELERQRKVYEDEQRRMREEMEELRAHMVKETHLLESRVRFQQEHLQKARAELEVERQTMRAELQQAREQLEKDSLILRLRSTQLDQFRAILDERELSISREHQINADARRAAEQELDADRARFRAERTAWEEECALQQAELRRQQELVSLNAENLESRKLRLDDLRAELEQTHRNTLEIRLAVEETWAQLAQHTDLESARTRVDETRRVLEAHYQEARESLERLQEELREHRDTLARQQDDYRDERRSHSEWARARNEELQALDDRLRRDREDLETREAAWRSLRDQWMQEKAEAEQIIRGLLAQLSERTEASVDAGDSAA